MKSKKFAHIMIGILNVLFVVTVYSCGLNHTGETHDISTGKKNINCQDSIEILGMEKISLFQKKHKAVLDSETAVYQISQPGEVENYIVRLYFDGFYHFLFYKRANNKYNLQLKDSIPWLEYQNDSLFDANEDNLLDYLVSAQYSNGRYTPSFAYLYCYDSLNSSFFKIDKISNIPNPKFIPTKRMVVGEEELGSIKYIYNFVWKDYFNLEIIDTVELKK